MASRTTPDAIRARLADDIAAGKTVVLSTRELDDPVLRRELPGMLEELSREHHAATSGGPQIRGYTMLGEIGQGGMSTVYLARHESLGRHVAIKVAPKWLGGGARARVRLVQEARAMARVNHPNIVVIHDIIDVDDTFAIAMEWVDGRTLASLLRALPGDPRPDDMAVLRSALGAHQTDDPPDSQDAHPEDSTTRHFVRLMHEIALATQAVHEKGLLHLDIKPSNVLVRRDGTPLLADFGVVREISPELTQTRTFAGTPVYAAPEQLRRDDAVIGPRTDVYGLGVTLYEAIARSQPLRALDLAGIVQCVETGGMPRLSEKVAVPPDLENIVHKAIAPEPEHRYATPQALADDLLAFLEHRPVQARPLSRAQRLRRWARNEPWKAALAITLAIMLPALAGLGTYLALQLPRLERIEREERLQQANRLKQEAYQRWFTGARTARMCTDLLHQAMKLDPGDTSLACLLAMENEHGAQGVLGLLDEHADVVERNLGMRLYAAKSRAGRSFFNEHELAQLRGSTAPADRYLLALDRMFRAHDTFDESDFDESRAMLDEASLLVDSDPLLFGLQAWALARGGDHDRFEATVRAIASRWPDDVMVRSWIGLCIEEFQPERAKKLAAELIEDAPRHARGYEALVGAHYRTHAYDEALALRHKAADAGITSRELDDFERLIAIANGDLDAARELLQLDDRVTVKRRLRLTRLIDESRGTELAEAYLAEDNPSPHTLTAVYKFGDQHDLPAVRDRAWQLHRKLYRDRTALHTHVLPRLYQQRDFEHAAELVRELTLRARWCDRHAPFLVRILLYQRDWRDMRRHALRWHEHGEQRREAAWFAGLAETRLGNYREASSLFGEAIHATVAKKSWYVQALLEDALLRCSPQSPEEIRDPELAALRLRRFEERNPLLQRPHAGPWTQFIRAEVAFANGDREAAIEAAETGLRMRRREVLAPADYKARLRDALERYGD